MLDNLVVFHQKTIEVTEVPKVENQGTHKDNDAQKKVEEESPGCFNMSSVVKKNKGYQGKASNCTQFFYDFD